MLFIPVRKHHTEGLSDAERCMYPFASVVHLTLSAVSNTGSEAKGDHSESGKTCRKTEVTFM